MKKCTICLREFEENKTFCPYDGNRLIAAIPVDPLVNLILDHKYQVNNKIAEGGMGNVYRATHLQLDIPVAIKVLHQELVSDYTSIERFRREAQAAMKIRHTNAITVMDFGVTENNTVYLVMEYLEGCTLRQRLREVGHFEIKEANLIMQQVCGAVAAAHKRNIIHRDLKPDNIFLQKESEQSEEVVKVLDFGIAKLKNQFEDKSLTRQGMVVGTPHYMSPEQCYGRDIDVRSDIYSLGVILYEMLSGLPPFDAASPIALAIKQASEIPRPIYEFQSDFPEHINALVMQALEKTPDLRPQTVGIFAEALAKAVEQLAHFPVSHSKSHSKIDISRIDAELLDDICSSPTVVLSNQSLPSAPLPSAPLPSAPLSNGPLPSAPLLKPPAANNSNQTRPLINNERETHQTESDKNDNANSTNHKLVATEPLKDFENGLPPRKTTGKKPLWLPTGEAKTYPVVCEKCRQEVGRSMVRDSTIICPNCRTNMRRPKNSKS